MCESQGKSDVSSFFPCLLEYRRPPALVLYRWQRQFELSRALSLQRNVRVVKPQPVEVLVGLLRQSFTHQDSVDTIRQICIGELIHGQYSLERLLAEAGIRTGNLRAVR